MRGYYVSRRVTAEPVGAESSSLTGGKGVEYGSYERARVGAV